MRLLLLLLFLSWPAAVPLNARKCFIPERLWSMPAVLAVARTFSAQHESKYLEFVLIFRRRGWASFVAFILWRLPYVFEVDGRHVWLPAR